MEKDQVTQDALYEYLLAHDVKLSRLAELMDIDPDVVFSCFKHHKDWHGRPRKFNAEHIAAINEALPVIASELQARKLKFGSDRTYTNRWGSTYDPALVWPLKELGNYLNLSGMLPRLLGWSNGKIRAVLSRPNGKMFGCITQKDVTAINTEILSIIGVLTNYEVIKDIDKTNTND